MIAWDLLKELVGAKKELERVRLKYFQGRISGIDKHSPTGERSINAAIKEISAAIEELTFNLIERGEK